MRYSEIVREAAAKGGRGGRFYHGTKVAFDAFDPARAADGHAQEGCGFYFTTSRDEAVGYAGPGGWLLTCDLAIDRELPLRGRVRKAEIEALVRASPDLADVLMNWDEDPRRALAQALAAMMQDGPKASFEQVWYDFYRHDPAGFLAGVTKLGYDGTVVSKAPDPDGTPVSHAVMYNLAKIRVVSRDQV